ncbi:MAG: trigger factor [Patescibacteria group bacterium]
MQSNFKKLNNSQVKTTIELGKEDLQKYINKAEDIMGGGLEIKGFRKGKAPKEILSKHLDKEKVRALALEIALEASLSDVIKVNGFDVMNMSQLSVENNDSVQLKYSIILDLFPEIELADLDKIKVKRQDVKVEEKEVEDALETIKNSRASFIDKKNNEPAEEGDRVEVDFEVKTDGRIIEGGVSKNHPIIIGGKGFIPGFEDYLAGMKKGDEKSFSLTAPEDYSYKEIAGKKLDFVVKMNDIKKVVRPEANDDFARSLGRFADFTELKESVKENLTQGKKMEKNQKLRLEILDNIINLSKIEVPDSLLNKQLETMISDFDNTLHEKGLELGLYLSRIGKTQEELKKDWTKDAEKQVKIFLVLRRLAKDLKIEASQGEVEEMAGQAMQSAMANGETMPADIDPAKLKESIESRIVNEKTLEYIESHCAI